jgi:beta-galactosidase
MQMPAAAMLQSGATAAAPKSHSDGLSRILSQEQLMVHFGAVYFRKSGPPRKDWERDHKVAADDGHTLFRHWLPWNAIEVAPGRFDWDDYDRMMDLAAKNRIRVVLAEMLVDFPEWLIRAHPDARIETRTGQKRFSEMHVSCATGGHYALCLDHPEVAKAGERFLAAMALRYRGHPALIGYDIWNECTFYTPDRLCYCEATQQGFRAWLKARWSDVRDVGRRWNRHSLTSWEDVQLSRQVALFADFLDSQRFHLDNAFEWMSWRASVLRRIDPDHAVIAHGNARTFADVATCCGDDWRAADRCDIFGYTHYFGSGSHPLLAGDLIRSASRGKVFWRAEAVGDSQWMGRQIGTPRPEMDRMHDPQNIRLDALISMACGARAYQNPRWRPLLDGPLFGSFGWYGMNGSRTERSDEIKTLAEWAHSEQARPLWQARPARGEAGILIIEEAQAHCYAAHGDTSVYGRCIQGAWRAFTDSNINVDFVRVADLQHYEFIYLPYPVALSDQTLAAVLKWVSSGGHLVAEAAAGYFNDLAHAFEEQPSRGWSNAAGCVEGSISFGLDRMDTLVIRTTDGDVAAGVYRQSYKPGHGKSAGTFVDGTTAIVDATFGKGGIRQVGSMPSYGYWRSPADPARKWFRNLLAFTGKGQSVSVSVPRVVTRVWQQPDGKRFLWVLNENDAEQVAVLSLRHPATQRPTVLRGSADLLSAEESPLAVRVPGRDAVVLAL